MNNDILHLLRKYSFKYNHQITKICAPLIAKLSIPYFFYTFLEENGRCTILGNDLEYLEFYYGNKMHLNHPYWSHPMFFRSGYALIPSAFEDDQKKIVQQKHAMSHLFLTLQASKSQAEGFFFYNKKLGSEELPFYVENLDLLKKFNRYFKREAASLIGKIHAEGFNMHEEQQESFLNHDNSFSLSNRNLKKQNFLKSISPLSPQEERCLELYKQGHSAQATGAILGLSRRTVESYFEHIKNKLNCNCKSELLAY